MISLTLSLRWWNPVQRLFARRSTDFWIGIAATALAIGATAYAYHRGIIVAYGDAESHLNIAKRVVSNLTPGLAQLGGIWLPLPHLLMVPLVTSDFLWRSGLAGSIVGGLSYVISAVYIYRLLRLMTRHTWASVIGTSVFLLNPAVLYLQATPMTELPLIVFFVLSSYYFVRFIYDRQDILALIYAAVFGFCATLSRYDGWFLVAMEAGIVVLLYLPLTWRWTRHQVWRLPRIAWQKNSAIGTTKRQLWQAMEGRFVLFATMAFFGIALWLAWDALILGDPLYFTHSQFSASSQQQGWLARGELPTYHHLWLSFSYYFVTAMNNSGVLPFFTAVIGAVAYLAHRKNSHRWIVALLLLAPFVFYVVTLFLGQSVIFIPHVTPTTFEWTLFNVRYGVMMVPVTAVFLGYLWYSSRNGAKWLIISILIGQLGLYGIGYSPVLSYRDGIVGLSASKRTTAETWMHDHYDSGLVLMDDFARTMSVIRSGIPMQQTIYIGNKPYWEESLQQPEKYASWIIMQEHDTVWDTLLDNGPLEQRLYTHFAKVYTSPNILIFHRTSGGQ